MNKSYTIFIVVISIVIVSVIGGTVWYLNNQAQDQGNISSSSSTPTPSTPNTPSNSGSNAFPSSATNNNAGSNNTTLNPTSNANTQTNQPVQESVSGDIKKKDNVGVAGITFVETSANNTQGTFLRYIEKGTGHIKDISFDETIPTKISNTTMTGIFDAFWNNDSSVLIIRRLDGVKNNLQTIYGIMESGSTNSTTPEGEVGTINGVILPDSIKDIAISPLKDKVFYLSKNGDSIIGSISDFNKNGANNTKNQVFSSSFSEWTVSWPTASSISLLTKPAYNVLGQLYSIELSKNNGFEKVIGNTTGITSIKSLSGNKIVYSETTGAGFMAYYFDTNTKKSIAFPVKTLPEKCVWSKINENILYCGVPKVVLGAKYPDSWYQGVTSFSDDIYEVNLDSNSAKILIDAKLNGQAIDVINPILSEREDYLGFINKKDNTPFMVKVK